MKTHMKNISLIKNIFHIDLRVNSNVIITNIIIKENTVYEYKRIFKRL